jgi:hypothetical protein
MQIHAYNAEDVLLNYHNQELMFNHISEQKESTREAEELQPEPKESHDSQNFLRDLDLLKQASWCLEDNDLNEQK